MYGKCSRIAQSLTVVYKSIVHTGMPFDNHTIRIMSLSLSTENVPRNRSKFLMSAMLEAKYEGRNFNSGNYLFTTDTK